MTASPVYAAKLEECSSCEGTAVTRVPDGCGIFDDVECGRCVDGWVTLDGQRPAGELGRYAADHPHLKVEPWP